MARDKQKVAAACARWYQKNKAHVNAKSKRWREANPARLAELARLRRAADPVAHKTYMDAWYRKNADAHKANQAAWARRNAGKHTARVVAYKAAKLRATPRWADHTLITEAYDEGAFFGLEVDHIVPLVSPLVCGLHVWDNLQLLDMSVNRSKGNRSWPDMPR